ncbi:MAG TPA: Crp/Fnr family transcriptional regulator [Vicinamibacterales bacterium]|nr:Crp/Fnr family transcriptional regulator [Vicinamibacterales bacterium]
MVHPDPAVLARIPLFSRVSPEDRARLAGVAQIRSYERGDSLFQEGDDSDHFMVVMTGRVKVFKRTPAGNDRILELFGPGGPVGAVAAYAARPFMASAEALEPTTCLMIPRRSYFALLEQHPSLARGLLASLSLRLVELTTRLTELTGGRIESRLARLFLKLADQLGRPERGGTFIPLALGRQEIADMTGTTIETCIRIMSRWGKDEVLRTEKDGFVLLDRAGLETVANS